MGDFNSMPVHAPTVPSRLVGLVRATHPGPTLAVTALTTVLALGAGLGQPSWLVAIVVLTGQCSVGWSNDAIDAERDRAAGRTDKPVVAGLVGARSLLVGALGAAAISVVLALGLGWRACAINAVALASAWSYNLVLKSSIMSPLPYGVSFALLPAFVAASLPGHPAPRAAALVAGGLLGLGAHFINTLKDVDADRLTGVNGLPQRLGPDRSLRLGVACLAGALVAILLAQSSLSASVVALGLGSLGTDVAVLVLARRGAPRAAWRATLVSAGLCAALFAASGSSLVGS